MPVVTPGPASKSAPTAMKVGVPPARGIVGGQFLFVLPFLPFHCQVRLPRSQKKGVASLDAFHVAAKNIGVNSSSSPMVSFTLECGNTRLDPRELTKINPVIEAAGAIRLARNPFHAQPELLHKTKAS